MLRRHYGLLAGLLVLGLCGCNGAARITATVVLDDAPLANAQVTLLPEDRSGPGRFRGTTADDGTLELPLAGEPSLPPGRYKVLVIKEAIKKGARPPAEMKNDPTQLRVMGMMANVLPPRYADASTTPLSADVVSGSNSFRFVLTSK
jgi:hypothetical protein